MACSVGVLGGAVSCGLGAVSCQLSAVSKAATNAENCRSVLTAWYAGPTGEAHVFAALRLCVRPKRGSRATHTSRGRPRESGVTRAHGIVRAGRAGPALVAYRKPSGLAGRVRSLHGLMLRSTPRASGTRRCAAACSGRRVVGGRRQRLSRSSEVARRFRNPAGCSNVAGRFRATKIRPVHSAEEALAPIHRARSPTARCHFRHVRIHPPDSRTLTRSSPRT